MTDLFTTSSRHVPMAPSTALVMFLAAMAVLCRERWPTHAAPTRFGYGAMGVVALAGVLALVRFRLGWGSPLEEWLAQTTERVGAIPLGQMSPLTGTVFLVAAISFFLHSPPAGNASSSGS